MIHTLREGGAKTNCGCRLQHPLLELAAIIRNHTPSRTDGIMEYGASSAVAEETPLEDAVRIRVAEIIETFTTAGADTVARN